VCRGWRRVCDTCPALWERVSDEEVDTSSPEKVASFLCWCSLRAGAIRRLRIELKRLSWPYPLDDDACKKKREVACSLAFALGACGGALEELVLGESLHAFLPRHPHWVASLKRLRTLEIGYIYDKEQPFVANMLYALRTHCPGLRHLVLGFDGAEEAATALFPLGLESLEFNGSSSLAPTLTQLTRLTHLCWDVYDPIKGWRVAAALTSLQTMAVRVDHEYATRLPQEISALRNLRELSLELDPLDDDEDLLFWRWKGLEVGRPCFTP
jgi:hypothetical protein